LGNEQYESTSFERDLRSLAERLAGYNFTPEKLKQWGLARDYLMKQLRDYLMEQLNEENKDKCDLMKNAYMLADDLYKNEGDFEVHYKN